MSTDYTVTLTSSDDSTTMVKIIDSINPLPGFDKFEGNEAEIGAADGPARIGDDTFLNTGPGASGGITLTGFNKSTKKNAEGDGSKESGKGTFPDGALKWKCNEVD